MNWLKQILLASGAFAALTEAKKLFIDNDEADAGTILIPLMAGFEIVGVSGSFGSASYVDSIGGHYDILETYNLSSCIPLYGGASKPLLRTNETFHVWEDLFGTLTWEGGWSAEYADAHSWDNFTYDDSVAGAVAMVEAVKKYKDTDPVIIYAAGTMTTVAQAISIYPDLVKDAAGLYIMGGYFDGQWAKATGPSITDDLNTDINLIQDPEAAQMVLTADWDYIYVGGNVTNYEVPSQAIYDRFIERAGGLNVIEEDPYYSILLNSIIFTGNFTENNEQQTLPFWDKVVSACMAYPDLITGTAEVAFAVDTSFYSPFYGNAKIWSHDRSPKALKTGNVTIIDSIESPKFYDILIDSFFQNYTQLCATGNYFPVA